VHQVFDNSNCERETTTTICLDYNQIEKRLWKKLRTEATPQALALLAVAGHVSSQEDGKDRPEGGAPATFDNSHVGQEFGRG